KRRRNIPARLKRTAKKVKGGSVSMAFWTITKVVPQIKATKSRTESAIHRWATLFKHSPPLLHLSISFFILPQLLEMWGGIPRRERGKIVDEKGGIKGEDRERFKQKEGCFNIFFPNYLRRWKDSRWRFAAWPLCSDGASRRSDGSR